MEDWVSTIVIKCMDQLILAATKNATINDHVYIHM
jgi:hypothetical protein